MALSKINRSLIIFFFIIIDQFFCWAKMSGSSPLQEAFSSLQPDDTNRVDIVNIIRPVVHDLRTTRQIRSIAKNHVDHAEELTVSLINSSIILDLQLNRDLLPDNFYVRYHVDGKEDIWRTDRSLLCHYTGTVRNLSNSWVTLSTCSGLSGAVFDGSNVYFIDPVDKNTTNLDGDHLWTKRSKNISSCQGGDLVNELTRNHGIKVKREAKTAGSTHNLELVLVVDHTIYRRNNGDMYKILKRVIDIANVLHEIYSKIRVSIVLVGVVVWSEVDEINIERDASLTLNSFRKFSQHAFHSKSHDASHLLTGVRAEYFNGLVGRAFVGTLCQSHHEASGVVVDNAEKEAAFTASVLAHEMGHNFGMQHDDFTLCSCRTSCVMEPSIGKPTMEWSSCSQNAIRNYRHDSRLDCLLNKPNLCGNMIVDPGEECDCGLPKFCKNKCCDPLTCKYSKHTVKCATGPCCDLENCQFKSTGTVCRSNDTSGCDLPEFCLGDSSLCPTDLYKFDGVQCENYKSRVCEKKVCIPFNEHGNKGNKLPRFTPCPVDCNNNGVCNNLGKCHCQVGYSPPDCKLSGYGGSEDGGQGWDPKITIRVRVEQFVMLGVVPVIIFLFFCFYYFLKEEQKIHFKFLLRKLLCCCQDDRLPKVYDGLRPVPLNQSTSVDKSAGDPDGTRKRDFSKWVKTRVSLTLPSITIPSISGSMTPMSGCSTATTMSALNTPDDAQFTPITLLPQPGISDKKLLLTPPVHRLRQAPPPPPKFDKRVNDASNKAPELGDSSNNRSQVSKEKPPPPPPPNSAKPKTFPFRPPPKA